MVYDGFHGWPRARVSQFVAEHLPTDYTDTPKQALCRHPPTHEGWPVSPMQHSDESVAKMLVRMGATSTDGK